MDTRLSTVCLGAGDLAAAVQMCWQNVFLCLEGTIGRSETNSQLPQPAVLFSTDYIYQYW